MHHKQMVQMQPVYFSYWEGDLDDLFNSDYDVITVSVMLADLIYMGIRMYLLQISLQMSLQIENWNLKKGVDCMRLSQY